MGRALRTVIAVSLAAVDADALDHDSGNPILPKNQSPATRIREWGRAASAYRVERIAATLSATRGVDRRNGVDVAVEMSFFEKIRGSISMLWF
jgi:hypothetical protein